VGLVRESRKHRKLQQTGRPNRTGWASTPSWGPASITARPTATCPCAGRRLCGRWRPRRPNCRNRPGPLRWPGPVCTVHPCVSTRRICRAVLDISFWAGRSRFRLGQANRPRPSSTCAAGLNAKRTTGLREVRAKPTPSRPSGLSRRSASTMKGRIYKVKGPGALRVPPPVGRVPLRCWIGAAAPWPARGPCAIAPGSSRGRRRSGAASGATGPKQ